MSPGHRNDSDRQNADMKISSETNRINGIDAFRFIAFVFIVLLHARGQESTGFTKNILEIIPRFGVPFFFLVSGYFINTRSDLFLSNVWKFTRRLAPIYIFWLVVYLLLYRMFHESFGIESRRALFIQGGPAFHLWFLPSLGICVVLSMALFALLPTPYVTVVGLLFYCIGLYFVEFAAPFGPTWSFWNFRDGPFFGLIFVIAGHVIRQHAWRPKLTGALFMTMLGLALSIIERYALTNTGVQDAATPIDYTTGTLLFGTGVLMTALSVPNNSSTVNWLAGLGRYTLGYYCIHVMFLWLIQSMMPLTNTQNILLATGLTVLLSVASILALSRIRIARSFIA